MSPGGRPRKANPKLKKMITVDQEVWQWSVAYADSRGIGFSTLVEQLLRELRDKIDK